MYIIEQIVTGTIFRNGPAKYELSNDCWSINAPTFPQTDLIGGGKVTDVRSCHPILGGQIQSKIKKWIRIDAEISLD